MNFFYQHLRFKNINLALVTTLEALNKSNIRKFKFYPKGIEKFHIKQN
jgi:hypothetical protein